MVGKLVLSLTILGFAGTAPAPDQFAGTWRLSVANSKFAAGVGVKALSVVIVEAGANLVVSETGTDGAGEAISIKYTFPAKGGDLSFAAGAPASEETVTIARLGETTLNTITHRNGFEVGTSLITLSGDGKTLTRSVKSVDASGKVLTNTEVYQRQ